MDTKIIFWHPFCYASSKNSQDWFVMWMGLLSYAVALAEMTQALQPAYTSKDVLKRNSLIKNTGFSELWFEAIPLNAKIYVYLYNVDRSGVILAFPPQDTDQPSPTWLNNHGIPFWYRLGKEEETYLKSIGLFHIIAPLPYQIQRAFNLLLEQPSIHLSRNFCYMNTSTEQTSQHKSVTKCSLSTHPTRQKHKYDPTMGGLFFTTS